MIEEQASSSKIFWGFLTGAVAGTMMAIWQVASTEDKTIDYKHVFSVCQHVPVAIHRHDGLASQFRDLLRYRYLHPESFDKAFEATDKLIFLADKKKLVSAHREVANEGYADLVSACQQFQQSAEDKLIDNKNLMKKIKKTIKGILDTIKKEQIRFIEGKIKQNERRLLSEEDNTLPSCQVSHVEQSPIENFTFEPTHQQMPLTSKLEFDALDSLPSQIPDF